MTPPAQNPRFVLTLEALPDPNAKHGEKYARDSEYRLKLLLKRMLRSFGFRCVKITEIEPPATNL